MFSVKKIEHTNSFGVFKNETLFATLTPACWDALYDNRALKKAEMLACEFNKASVDETFWRYHRLNVIFVP
jgi:hypothetical protein